MDDTKIKPNGHDKPLTVPGCWDCEYFFPYQGNVMNGTCREGSPAAVMVGMEQALLNQPPRPVVNGYFPQTSAGIICGKHPRWREYVEMRTARIAEQTAAAADQQLAAIEDAEADAPAKTGIDADPAGQA
jgi:hypothetical protein